MKPRIMYIERKEPESEYRIGRVEPSQTGATLYYAGMTFRSAKGGGFKSNYFEVEKGDQFWISNPRRDGNDSHYPAVVEIDDDVREEYWTMIREAPQRIEETSYRSPGKYSRRRPRPELNVNGSTRNGGDRGGKRR
jgi:hypothetical protein